MKNRAFWICFVFLLTQASAYAEFRAPSAATLIPMDLSESKVARALGKLERSQRIPERVCSYIESETDPGSPERRALWQLAIDYQIALHHLRDQAVLSYARNILKSEFCVRAQFGTRASHENKKIHTLFLQNHLAARLGIRLNTQLARVIPYLLEEGQWRSECRF